MCGLCLHRFFDLLIERVIWHILCVQSKQRRLMYTQWLNAHAYRRSLREEPPVRTTAGRSGLTHTRILRIINLCSAMHYEQISSTASIETANTRLNGNIWIGHCVILQCRVESVTWYININWPFIMFLLLCVVTKSVCVKCACVCALIGILRVRMCSWPSMPFFVLIVFSAIATQLNFNSLLKTNNMDF